MTGYRLDLTLSNQEVEAGRGWGMWIREVGSPFILPVSQVIRLGAGAFAGVVVVVVLLGVLVAFVIRLGVVVVVLASAAALSNMSPRTVFLKLS